MANSLKKCRKMIPLRVVGMLAAIAVNASISVKVWSQSGHSAQRPKAVAGPVMPSLAQLATFNSCLETNADQNIWRQCGDPIYDVCNRNSGSPDTTYVMSMCLMSVNSAWDQRLNQLYRTTLAAQAPTARVSLRAAQRIWITSRDADCSAVYEANISGSIRSVAAASCRVNATRHRVEWLSGFGEP